MKNLLKKLIVVLFLLLMLINNSLLVVISNAVDAIQSNVDQTRINPVYELNLQKYVNYVLEDGTKGLMLQANLKTGIKYDEGEEYKPLEFTGIVLDLPKLNNEYPEKVEVIGNSTKATNGSDSAKYFESIYDSASGKIRIVALNRIDDDGNIYTENVENSRDDYTIFVYYSAACYNDKNIDKNIEINGKVQISLNDDEKTQVSTEIKQNYDVKDNISGLISVNAETNNVYNGFINSNKVNNTSYATEYSENLKIDIGYKEIADEVKISSKNSFMNGDIEKDTNDIIYKSTKIYKQDVLDKLGEDGYLKIFDKNGELLGEINKDTETSDDGAIEFKYEEEVTDLVISLSKPLNLGILNIQNIKQIKETMKDIEITKIKTAYSVEADRIYSFSNDVFVDVNDSETKVDVNIDTDILTNNTQNDVNFTLNLVANENRYNLFKNPAIEIKLPSEVENVILGDVSLLYGNGLKIKDQKIIEKNSCKVIRIELEGSQSEYMLDSMITGSNILIPASIIVKKDIESTEANIEVTYSNENGKINDYEKEGKTFKENKINIESVITEDEPRVLRSFAFSPNQQVIESDELSTEMNATVGNQVLSNDSIIYEEQIIKYTAKIVNSSDKRISNVEFVGVIPDGTTYVNLIRGEQEVDDEQGDDFLYQYVEDTSKKTYSESFPLEAHEEKEIYYEVKVNKLVDENEKTIESNLKIYSNSVEKANFGINNIVKKADMSVELKSWVTYIRDNIYLYRLKINNNKSEELKNIHAELFVPDGIEVTETDTYEYEVTQEDNKIMLDLDKIDANATKYMDLYIKINQTIPNVYEYNVNVYAVVQATGTDKYYSNENRLDVYMKGIEVIQTSEKEGKKVGYREEIEYDFVIRNISNINTVEGDLSLNINDFIDENVEPISAEYEVITYNEETGKYETETKTEDFKNIVTKIDGEEVAPLQYDSELPVGQEIKLKLKVEAGLVAKDTVIISNISVKYGNKTKISNTVKNILVPVNSNKNLDDDNNDNNNNQNGKYSIGGMAWIDSDSNGQKDDNEQKLSNVKVSLYNVNTNSIAKDDKNKEITTVTDANGLYKFNDIVKGKYLVVFEYDSSNYNLTNYKKVGVLEQNNSDVIEKQLQIGNELKTVGVTDTLIIDSRSINNINIGIVPKQKYDLSLNKTITNVTVEYDGKKKENSYNDAKLAKVEISAKKISKSTITVEYQIEVKNEGDVDAYVDEIIDYKPETLEFDGSINPNWSYFGNGKLICSDLSGIRIKAGESKFVKLYLTKDMTDSSVGTITNIAEIGKSSNVSNLTDIDSVENNKNANEDDYSEAQLIISIGTGAVTYIVMFIILLIILTIVRYLVKKNVISIKNASLVLMLLSTFIIVFISNINISDADLESKVKDAIFNADAKDRVLNLRYSTSGLADHWYDNYYIHHVNVDLHNAHPGYLWCSDGRTMCGGGNHYYHLKKEDIEVTKIKKVSTSGAEDGIELENDLADEPISTGNNGYVGPFQISSNFNGANSSNTDIFVYDYDGIELEKGTNYEIVDGEYGRIEQYRKEIVNEGSVFYIQLLNGTPEIAKVKIVVESTTTEETTVKYKADEYWRCTSCDCGSCSPSEMQVMLRKVDDEIKIGRDQDITAKLVLKTKKKVGGMLQLVKIDDARLEDGTLASSKLIKEYPGVLTNNSINAGFGDPGAVTRLPGVTFTIFSLDAAGNEIYKTAAVTNGEGIISVEGLDEGWYRVRETASIDCYPIVGNSFDIYISEATVNTINQLIYAPNTKLTDISGFVWYDALLGKNQTGNNWYDDGENPYNGITVSLKDAYGNIVNNIYGQPCIMQTSQIETIYAEIAGGKYYFSGIKVNELNYYHLEFSSYNGLIYQAVAAGTESRHSKATEIGRDALDAKFANGIVNNGDMSVNASGSDVSVGYEVADAYAKKIKSDSISGCDISANIGNLASLYNGYSITYANLGIYEKPQADLRIDKDVNHAVISLKGTINGEELDETSTPIYHKLTTNDNGDPNSNAWDNSIQFQTDKEGYKISAFKEDIESGLEYSLIITYKIAIVNQSIYNTSTTSIVDYFSSDFDIVSATGPDGVTPLTLGATEVVSDATNDRVINTDGTTKAGTYNKCVISGDIRTNSGKGNWIYVSFKVKAEKWQEYAGYDVKTTIGEYNVAEINSYKVFKDEFVNTVAAVDEDSVPGNAKPGNIATYEDDTDAAPTFKIILRNRELRGTVFIDKDEISGEGNIRQGNGIFDDREEKVKGVLVSMDGSTTKNVETDADGNYEFIGFLPGKYEIKFTWGDNEHRVQEYKQTIYIEGNTEDNTENENKRSTNIEWYRDTVNRYSDAFDDYQQRIEIDKETSSIMDRSINDELDKAYGGESSKITHTTLDSITPKMHLPMIYDANGDPGGEYKVENIDFGIVERAKQELEVQKRITEYKITLANGNPLVDATIDDSGILQGSFNHTTFMGPNAFTRGYIKTEVDNELIEGATLELVYRIKYVNRSEKDYMTEDYYKYGNKAEMSEDDLVTVIPYGVVDYLDKNLSFDVNKNNDIWNLTKKSDIDKYYTDKNKNQNLGESLLNTKTLLYSQNKIKTLKPGESDSIELKDSALLSTPDNLTFKNNEVDTVQITKTIVESQHLGRFVKEFPSAQSEKVIITSNTGENRGYVLFIVIGIVMLGILGVGIYFIKTRILDNKK